MAKADYLLEDQWGRAWLVRPGDPAHEMLRALPAIQREIAVLPRKAIIDGWTDIEDLESAERRLGRLSNYAADDPSSEVYYAVTRTVQLVSTLKALKALLEGQ